MSHEEEAAKAHDIATSLLAYLGEAGAPLNIAQAALGSAWVRICEVMGFTRKEFKNMSDEVADAFEERHDTRS